MNGVRILDTLLDALYTKGITNITIVRGYKKEQFDQLLEKYPTIKFIDNPEFNLANNISSAIHAIDLIDRCYICEADLYIPPSLWTDSSKSLIMFKTSVYYRRNEQNEVQSYAVEETV